MLTVNVHFLTGVYAATSYNDRAKAEWPPHPARLFSALVDALHHDDEQNESERHVLDALADLGPPTIFATSASARSVKTHFVPVNDAAVTDGASLVNKEAALDDAEHALATLSAMATTKERTKATKQVEKAYKSLMLQAVKSGLAPTSIPKNNPAPNATPWGRTRQNRFFPAVIPDSPHVAFQWDDAALSDAEYASLSALCRRVARLGHSSSLIVIEPQPTGASTSPQHEELRPAKTGAHMIRVPLQGQRQALEQAHEQHQGMAPGRVLPAKHVPYNRAGELDVLGNTRLSDARWVAYRFLQTGPYVGSTASLANTVRSAILHFAKEPISSWISGHNDQKIAKHEHLTVLGLPFVGHRYADGHLRGIAVLLPSDAPPQADRALLAALGAWEAATNANERYIDIHTRHGVRQAERVVDEAQTLVSLQSGHWSQPSKRWCTVTPIALDGECPSLHHATGSVRRKAHKVATKLIKRSVHHAVNPPDGIEFTVDDIGVELDFGVPINGGAPARQFLPFQRSTHERARRVVHARIELPFAVTGPLVLGSGRHFGLGLCLPLNFRTRVNR